MCEWLNSRGGIEIAVAKPAQEGAMRWVFGLAAVAAAAGLAASGTSAHATTLLLSAQDLLTTDPWTPGAGFYIPMSAGTSYEVTVSGPIQVTSVYAPYEFNSVDYGPGGPVFDEGTGATSFALPPAVYTFPGTQIVTVRNPDGSISSQDTNDYFGVMEFDAVLTNFNDPDFSYTTPDVTVTYAVVPEPSAWAMMIVGLGGLGALMRRRPRRAFC
jgi:hypothetical protein